MARYELLRSRSLLNNVALKIGLDPSLASDATAAQQALVSIPRMEALPLRRDRSIETNPLVALSITFEII